MAEMKRKWTEQEKILAHHKFPPRECIGCYVAEPEKGECHIFRKGALCIVCAAEVKADSHRNLSGNKINSAAQFLELLKEAHTIHLQAEEIMREATERIQGFAVDPYLPGFDSIYQS